MNSKQKMLALVLAGVLGISVTSCVIYQNNQQEEQEEIENQGGQGWGYYFDIDYHKKHKSSHKSFKSLGSSSVGGSGS